MSGLLQFSFQLVHSLLLSALVFFTLSSSVVPFEFLATVTVFVSLCCIHFPILFPVLAENLFWCFSPYLNSLKTVIRLYYKVGICLGHIVCYYSKCLEIHLGLKIE